MSRLVSCFLLSFLLNTGAGSELFPLRLRSGQALRHSSWQALPHSSGQALAQGNTAEARGEWLARKVEDRDRGRDVRMSMRMRLYDRQRRVRERALTIVGLRGGPGPSTSLSAGRPVPGDRSLIRFTYPNDIAGTGFLVWEHPGGEDERFLYLPSLGRVRRIAGSETQQSFVGSDFTYEDIGGREIENYRYRLIESKEWVDPAGAKFPVHVLESISRSADARFPRVISLVRQDVFVVVQAEIHNKRDELQKTFVATDIEKRGGYWTALTMTMTDAVERTCTELVVEDVKYDTGVTVDDVSRRALESAGPASALRASTGKPSAAGCRADKGGLQGVR
jgi:outer membrane lipoprotein-sorting protein